MTSFERVLAAWAAGLADAAELQQAFEAATLFVQRVPGPAGEPAVAAVGPQGAGFVAMFSSLEALGAYAGECDWASASSADLLELVPPGYGVMVDPGGPHPAVLVAAAITRGVVISGSLR